MFGSILPRPSYADHLLSFNDGDPDGGAGGDPAGGGGAPPPEPKGATLTKDEVDSIVKGRVESTRKATADSIAKDLGVSIEDAKRIIKEAQDRDAAQKTEAERAKDAADAAKADSDKEKEEAAQEKHDARVERLLTRALPKDLDDEALDKRIVKVGRLLDVEVGADEASIKAAIVELKKEMPELFPTDDEGTPPKGGAPRVPSSDPNGKPPKKVGQEDAFAKGQERAKAKSGAGGYAILQNNT